MDKKPDLTLVFGGKGAPAPKAEGEAPAAEKAPLDARGQAGKALAAALRRGDGAMIADAFEELLGIIDGDDEDEESLEEPVEPEMPF